MAKQKLFSLSGEYLEVIHHMPKRAPVTKTKFTFLNLPANPTLAEMAGKEGGHEREGGRCAPWALSAPAERAGGGAG